MMSKRSLGTMLMVAGFVYVLIVMFLSPEAKEASMLGFAMIGFGCVMGVGDKPKSKNQLKIKETKKKKK